MSNETQKNNILLAEYFAYCKFTFKGGSNFIVKKTDNVNLNDNEIRRLHNAFPIGNDYIKYMCNTSIGENASLKFHQKWDWIIPVFSRVYKEEFTSYYDIQKRGLLVMDFYKAVQNDQLNEAYKIIVKLVKMVNNAWNYNNK